MFCRILLKCMFTMLNRQTQSKNATVEFTRKEIPLYFVRKNTIQLRSTRPDFWQRIASIVISNCNSMNLKNISVKLTSEEGTW
jgi:hypothetical protein